MSKYKAILEELSQTALNYPAGELAELLKKKDEELTDEDVTSIADNLKTRYRGIVSQISKNGLRKQEAEEKVNEGMRRKGEEYEKLLKQSFGLDSDKAGHELIDEIKQAISHTTASAKTKELTDDDVKKHPAFIRAENEYKKQLREAKENGEKSVSDLKADYQRKEVFAGVSKQALLLFDKLNPVLSDKPETATSQRELLLEKLGAFDYEDVDGKFIPVYKDGDKKGKRVENDLFQPVEFDDLVKNTATRYFDFKVADDRQAPNGSQKTGEQKPNGQSYTGKMPKTEAEFNQMQNDARIPIKDRLAIVDHWEKTQAKV